MATKKAGGTAKNLRDSQPKFLGVKRASGTFVKTSEVIVRQRGTRYMAGKNVRVGRDHTLMAGKDGVVSFGTARKTNYDGSRTRRSIVSIIPK